MIATVLMNRNTGDLMIGYKVLFVEQESQVASLSAYCVSLTASESGGWVIEHPMVCPFYLNNYCENFFENLGEL